MKLLLTALLCLSFPLVAQDAVNEAEKVADQKLTNTIEPGKHIFGHPFGITEKDFIEIEGHPLGYMGLENKRTILIYGNSHGFIFTDGKLTGLRITRPILDWRFFQEVPQTYKRDPSDWVITNGVHANMSQPKLIELFKNKLHFYNNKFFTKIVVGGCEIELNFFQHHQGGGTPEERMQIGGIYLNQLPEKK